MDIENASTEQLLQEHCNIQKIFKEKGITQAEINHLCELERELTIREVIY